ncbi:conserved hypothetical protein [Crenothrix polyspora]|jgi:fructosamine-3-kinase|uniref:Fructosamine kinase family protein n=1 Tax=Crenothrix polyspora TaxID=360316 RepID=A0A1R4H6B7_9GAMM|nr:fructosamine kinase family protein [Crenothrix polyspora]SJM91707.1 conserved hypothetical protein [Crenothrix polyspora]
MNWDIVSEQISNATGSTFKIVSAHPVSGGDINTAVRLQGRHQSYFVKLNNAALINMFEAEFNGLQEMANTETVSVPRPIVCGKIENQAFLVLEYIEFGAASKAADRLLGQQLALLHQKRQPYYGWHRDNTIGSTPQINSPQDDWLSFWRNNRLAFQLKLAAKKGYTGRLQTLGEQLCSDMNALFAGYTIQASLIHGDLWAGNAAVDSQGQPVIFDPACYYGDREADIAMTELFGGFSQDFYAGYQQVWPLDDGYKTRKNLYNLYHILNHLNLFGGGYLRQAENRMVQLIAEMT